MAATGLWGKAVKTPTGTGLGLPNQSEGAKTATIRRRRRLRLPVLCFATLAASALATWLLPGFIVDQMLARDTKAGIEAWGAQIVDQIASGPQAFLSETLTPADLVLLGSIPRTSDTRRIDLINLDGKIFWSSEPGAIGQDQNQSGHDAPVASGEIHYDFGFVAADSWILGSGAGSDDHINGTAGPAEGGRYIAEIGLPVLLEGRLVGTLEIFRDKTKERTIFVARVQALMAAMTALAGSLFVGLGYMSFRENRRRMQDIQARTAIEHGALADQLRLARDVRLLGELNEWLQSSRSLDELFDMVGRFMTHLLPQCEGSIYVYSNSRDVLDGCTGWNGGKHKAHIHPDECWGLRRGRTYAYGQSDIEFVCAHAEPHDGRPYICFPILAHGETVGLMHLRAVEDVSPEDFNEGRRLAQMCAEQISLAIANVRMRDELHDQSVRDPLTGLYNRRHLTDALRKHMGKVGKGGMQVAVVSIDVDHFKRFNDNHGHDAGDMVLRAVGSVLTQNVDGDEIACRMGGEELMLLLPGAGQEAALARAEKVREAVQAITVRYGEKTLPRITISIGVAIAPMHGTLPQDLIRMADDALYVAKAKGRNQVILAGLSALDEAPAHACAAHDGSAACDHPPAEKYAAE